MKFASVALSAVATPALAADISAAAVARDPHLQWLRKWRQLRDEFNDMDGEGPEHAATWEQMGDLEELICITPATTAAGILAQFQFAMPEHGGYIETGTVWKDLDGKLFQNIETALKAVG
ncbi:hypothetical protein [Leisingera daeponensis]|uniref:hypothetical protein n=1 Tax=Leisingera daeponensis TaxID=405746 RepID=UPI001C96DD85|nr:hypothetical protein [Leisingera daeponensis]MBY6056355.1 hypothetical protein [Leisingera daeponensis]